MSNRGRGGRNTILDSMCETALSGIREENRQLNLQVENLVGQVKDLKKTVKVRNNTIKELKELQVVKDQAIDKLDELCESSKNHIETLQTEVATLVDQLDDILAGYIKRARERERVRKRPRTASESDETTR